MALSRLYLFALGALLIGYAIFDKGFAYLGYPPIFIGELFLAFSLAMFFLGTFSTRFLASRIVWILLGFVIWSAARTFPYLEQYGLNTLRDAVLWGYALFTFFVAGVFLRIRDLALAPRWFGLWFPWFLVMAPILFIVTQKYPQYIPRHPGSGEKMILMKAGDMGVHLAGIAAFMGLGLHRQFLAAGRNLSHVKEYALWMMWGAGVVVAGSRNRGGLLAVIAACLLVLLFKPMGRLNRVILPLLVVVLIGITFDVSIPVLGNRTISVTQIYENVGSIFFKSENTALSGTTSWRLEWWEIIRDETIFGKYFWDGQGYGANIAWLHGFADATGNRSPHNAHLNILSRSGVPGLVLWFSLVSCIGYFLIRGYFRMRALGHDTHANVNLWLAAYGVAFLVDASFDVYLEGPQGGIWFWCLVGYVVALTEEQRLLYARTTGEAHETQLRAPLGPAQ